MFIENGFNNENEFMVTWLSDGNIIIIERYQRKLRVIT